MTLVFNFGGGEIFIILAIILLLFGSKRIPEFARGLGKGIRMFKDATQDIQRDIQESTRDIQKDIKETSDDIKDEVDIKKHFKD